MARPALSLIAIRFNIGLARSFPRWIAGQARAHGTRNEAANRRLIQRFPFQKEPLALILLGAHAVAHSVDQNDRHLLLSRRLSGYSVSGGLEMQCPSRRSKSGSCGGSNQIPYKLGLID